MKSQCIFAFAALLVLASLIIEGDCIAPVLQGKGQVIYWNENTLIRFGQFFPTDLLKTTTAQKEHIG